MIDTLEAALYRLQVAEKDLRTINQLFLRGLAKPSHLFEARDEYERCLADVASIQAERERERGRR